MAFTVEISEGALQELKAIRPYDRKRIIDEIDDQLVHQPMAVTRNKKLLESVSPGFECVPPLWELRVEDYRVFYDVNPNEAKVYVRAVRFKGPDQATAEVIA
jgi:mRNA-degrading endonuclease RelE of RelBE toxin-antitoxin system